MRGPLVVNALGLAVALAGCAAPMTSAPPASSSAETKVLVELSVVYPHERVHGATSGNGAMSLAEDQGNASIAWVVHGANISGVAHADLHWGPTSIERPTRMAYPFVSNPGPGRNHTKLYEIRDGVLSVGPPVNGTASPAVEFALLLPMAPGDRWYVRAHVVVDGDEVWSDEASVRGALSPTSCGQTGPLPGNSRSGPPGTAYVREQTGFALWILGREVGFADDAYEFECMPGPLHFHRERPGIIDTEGYFPDGIPTFSLAQFLSQFGVDYGEGFLKLDTLGVHNGTRWVDDMTNRWTLYAAAENTPFRSVADGPAHVPRDGERLLLTYGNQTFDEIAREQSRVPSP